MNRVLEKILRSGVIDTGNGLVALHSHVREAQGLFLQRCVRSASATKAVETGCAYGISAMFIAEEMGRQSPMFEHTVIDPNQFKSDKWAGLGYYNLVEAGFAKNLRLIVEGSETALPKLVGQGAECHFAFIDGWHTFDHCLVDFFYIAKMLAQGGIVCFDDCDNPAVAKVLKYVLTYPAFEFFGAVARNGAELVSHEIDAARCVGIRKVGPDQRSWDWYVDF